MPSVELVWVMITVIVKCKCHSDFVFHGVAINWTEFKRNSICTIFQRARARAPSAMVDGHFVSSALDVNMHGWRIETLLYRLVWLVISYVIWY